MAKTLKAMRPKHWVKSSFCLVALFFSGRACSLEAWIQVLPLVLIFSLVSSSGYLLNDIWNKSEDQQHPRKKFRPIASGEVSVKLGLLVALALYFVSAGIGYLWYGFSSTTFCVGAYVVVSLLYTFLLREVVILDVLTISLGFVLRVCGGAYAIEVVPSVWLIGLTYLLSALLALGKRTGELQFVADTQIDMGATRPVLNRYRKDQNYMFLVAIAALLLVLYVAYCVVVQPNFRFLFTVIPVAIALFSYVRTARRSDAVETPVNMLLNGSVISACVLAWGAMVVGFLYT